MAYWPRGHRLKSDKGQKVLYMWCNIIFVFLKKNCFWIYVFVFWFDELKKLQEVYDKDTFSRDDEMGDADLDIKPLLEALRMHLNDLPNETIIASVKPTRTNCLAEESYITWSKGEVIQNIVLRLRNVVSGEIEIQLRWINVPGSKGLWNGQLLATMGCYCNGFCVIYWSCFLFSLIIFSMHTFSFLSNSTKRR